VHFFATTITNPLALLLDLLVSFIPYSMGRSKYRLERALS
jgi:hypothetical protein